jgi:putative endonuclease
MYYTYVIQSKKDNRLYTGSTQDLRKRFIEHNSVKVSSTKNRGPFVLIYYEACLNEQDARAREKYLKSGMGKRYLKNRLKRFLSLTGLMTSPEPKKRKIGFEVRERRAIYSPANRKGAR